MHTLRKHLQRLCIVKQQTKRWVNIQYRVHIATMKPPVPNEREVQLRAQYYTQAALGEKVTVDKRDGSSQAQRRRAGQNEAAANEKNKRTDGGNITTLGCMLRTVWPKSPPLAGSVPAARRPWRFARGRRRYPSQTSFCHPYRRVCGALDLPDGASRGIADFRQRTFRVYTR